MTSEVPDMSSAHINGDRPACEEPRVAKCPNCGKDVDSLYMTRAVRADIDMSYNVFLVKDSKFLWATHMDERDSKPDIRDTLDESYHCPHCGEDIPDCKSNDEAYKFLKGVK